MRRKPDLTDNWINGGYFTFKREVLNYFSNEEGCVLEKDPLVRLARDRELNIWKAPRILLAFMNTPAERIRNKAVNVGDDARTIRSEISAIK